MPYSDPRYDGILTALVFATSMHTVRPIVLDIGAGIGKAADNLREYVKRIDAVEGFQPYIARFKLHEKYTQVHCMMAQDLTAPMLLSYDIVIIGDVLEHLSVPDAQALLAKCKEASCFTFVQVPYLYEQGALEGNELEIHKQPDLTRELVKERYPSLVPIYTDERLGCYYQVS